MEGSKQAETESETAAPLLAIMGRFYPFDDSGIPFASKMLVIKEMQNQSNVGGDGGTGLNVWDGSLLLARYLEKRPDLVMGKTVLELGSGCGLVGIASAILGAKEVTMTDLNYALPLMQENVDRNELSWKGESFLCQRIECKECDWFQPPPVSELCGNSNRPDVILAADCVWLASLILPLLQTLKKYTTNASTKVIITYQQRGREAHEEFWEGVHDMFDVVVVDTEKRAGLEKPDVFHVLECSKKGST
eukprot:CAMPEP_0181083542 /NCGR_PEP_ID=MMETSP1071-20121207/4212_1 /TAXON_ID=35127 /ORGANISM="Thalassiosira sp., Strain NH16" /LENGTH=247 /DNA_ID=CAMNT_0023165205 /DNA_START=81 /DNA_END=824 /DNA_ORIENTATION=+